MSHFRDVVTYKGISSIIITKLKVPDELNQHELIRESLVLGIYRQIFPHDSLNSIEQFRIKIIDCYIREDNEIMAI